MYQFHTQPHTHTTCTPVAAGWRSHGMLHYGVLSNEDYTVHDVNSLQGSFSRVWCVVRVNTRAALIGYPKAVLCATSKLCQYSSGTNAVWHNRTLRPRTRRDNGRTAHSYFRPGGRAGILSPYASFPKVRWPCCSMLCNLVVKHISAEDSYNPTHWVRQLVRSHSFCRPTGLGRTELRILIIRR